MERKTLIVFLVILVILGGAGFWLLKPRALQPYQPEVEISTMDRNTQIFESLVIAGFDEPVVDVTDERVLVRYVLLAEMEKSSANLLAMTVAAQFEPLVPKIVIQVLTADLEPLEEAIVATSDVVQFIEGEITEEEFLKKIGWPT